MAAPVDSYIVLPDDSANTGKKARAQSRVVSGNTVYENEVVKIRQAQILGVYRACSAQLAVVASATNGTGDLYLLWCHMPTAVTNIKARLRRIYVTTQLSTVAVMSTAPRLRMDRMTFTGTASGATITAGKLNSSYGAPNFVCATAVTGLTPSLVAQLGNAAVVGALTAIGAWAPGVIDMSPGASEEDEWNVFAPGEGFVIYQDTAGTASDTRLANVVMMWDEIDTA